VFSANIACIFTLCNLCCGFFAIMLHVYHMDSLGLLSLIAAFFCDGLDGALARKTNAVTSFGERLDSLSDLVSFGMAPVFFAMSAHQDWEIGLTVGVALFLVCGAVRLARYDPTEQKHLFKGMPIPMGGLLLSAFSLTSGFLPWFAVAPALLGLLMISDIPFLKVSFHGWNKLLPICLGLFSVGVLIVYYGDVGFATLAFTVPYLLLNLMLAPIRDVLTRIRTAQARAAASSARVVP
jgi:CDP-diacylglycerol---serine O-phosphatidyltransferase